MDKFVGEYNKLVRDGIPGIARAEGLRPVTRTLNDDAYLTRLYEKNFEEAKEVQESGGDIGELGDQLEVIRAIAKAKGYRWADVVDAADVKRQQRGGFDEKTYLEEITE